MATLWITEYQTTAPIGRDARAQCGMEDGNATEQTVAYTTSTASSAFQDETRLVRVEADAMAHIAFGASPTATTSNKRIQANVPEYFGVPRGESFKIAAYDGTS